MILIEKGKERNSRIVRAEADTRRRILRIQSIDHCEQDHLLYRPIYILIYSFLLEMKVSQLVFYKLTKELEEEYCQVATDIWCDIDPAARRSFLFLSPSIVS